MPSKKKNVGPEAPGAAGPRPATEEGPKKHDVIYMRGKDWAIVEHEFQGRKYYYVRTYESERGLAEKLAEAFEKAAEKGLTDRVAVVYTRWYRDKRAQLGFYKNTLIIKIPDFISYMRLRSLISVADSVAKALYGDAAVEAAAEEEPEEGGQ